MKIKLIILLSIITTSICSVDKNLGSVIYITEQDYENLERKVYIIEDRLEEVRRDQLNYKVEKNLLKEVYSINYERINIGFTILLIIFGILGGFGVFCIKSIKKKYDDELYEMISMRLQLDTGYKDLDKKISDLHINYQKIKDENEETKIEQNNRIKIIEYEKKIKESYKLENYVEVLDFANNGLSLEENNLCFLTYKAICYGRLHNIQDAISLYEKVITIKPEHNVAIQNVLELYLLSQQFNKFNNLYGKNKDYINHKNEGILTIYYFVLKSCMENNYSEMISHAKSIIKKSNLMRLGKSFWIPEEAIYTVEKLGDPLRVNLFTKFVYLLNGVVSIGEFKKFIEKL